MLDSSAELATIISIAGIFAAWFILTQRGRNPNTIANIVTSIGILGTFVGIFIGLMNFNESDISGSISATFKWTEDCLYLFYCRPLSLYSY